VIVTDVYGGQKGKRKRGLNNKNKAKNTSGLYGDQVTLTCS
jgi:hypothetical protein